MDGPISVYYPGSARRMLTPAGCVASSPNKRMVNSRRTIMPLTARFWGIPTRLRWTQLKPTAFSSSAVMLTWAGMPAAFITTKERPTPRISTPLISRNMTTAYFN